MGVRRNAGSTAITFSVEGPLNDADRILFLVDAALFAVLSVSLLLRYISNVRKTANELTHAAVARGDDADGGRVEEGEQHGLLNSNGPNMNTSTASNLANSRRWRHLKCLVNAASHPTNLIVLAFSMYALSRGAVLAVAAVLMKVNDSELIVPTLVYLYIMVALMHRWATFLERLRLIFLKPKRRLEKDLVRVAFGTVSVCTLVWLLVVVLRETNVLPATKPSTNPNNSNNITQRHIFRDSDYSYDGASARWTAFVALTATENALDALSCIISGGAMLVLSRALRDFTELRGLHVGAHEKKREATTRTGKGQLQLATRAQTTVSSSSNKSPQIKPQQDSFTLSPLEGQQNGGRAVAATTTPPDSSDTCGAASAHPADGCATVHSATLSTPPSTPQTGFTVQTWRSQHMAFPNSFASADGFSGDCMDGDSDAKMPTNSAEHSTFCLDGGGQHPPLRQQLSDHQHEVGVPQGGGEEGEERGCCCGLPLKALLSSLSVTFFASENRPWRISGALKILGGYSVLRAAMLVVFTIVGQFLDDLLPFTFVFYAIECVMIAVCVIVLVGPPQMDSDHANVSTNSITNFAAETPDAQNISHPQERENHRSSPQQQHSTSVRRGSPRLLYATKSPHQQPAKHPRLSTPSSTNFTQPLRDNHAGDSNSSAQQQRRLLSPARSH